MNNTSLVKILIAAVAFIGGFVMGSLWTENKLLKSGINTTGTANAPTAAAPAGPTTEVLSKMPAISSTDHVRGNPNAKVMLVEYSDYQCPFCAQFHPTMEQLVKDYGDKIGWVYRYFPLTSIHPQAQISAQTGACVAKLGGEDAFWKFTDLVFKTTGAVLATGQNDLGPSLTKTKLVSYAAQSGVSGSAVQSCLDKNETQQLVTDVATGGSNAGINGTPGTILVTTDGQYELISGALPIDQVKTVIDKYL